MKRRDFNRWPLAGLAALGGIEAAHAQGKTLRLVVGFPAGGPADALARLLGQAMRARADGIPVVDNKPGAGGRLAAESMRTAEPDGSVLLVSPNPIVTIYPHVYRKLSYDPVKDLRPVARLVNVPLVVAVGPQVPASVRTLSELVAWLRANPDKSAFGSAGSGTSFHFIGQMIARAAGIELAHVAYKGEAPAIQDLLGGQIAMAIITSAAALTQLPGGRLRVIATSAPQRMAQLPELPTLIESGYDLQTSDWFAVFLPGAATPATQSRMQVQVRDAVASAEFREGLQRWNLQPGFLPGADLERMIRDESSLWAGIVRTTGFKPED